MNLFSAGPLHSPSNNSLSARAFLQVLVLGARAVSVLPCTGAKLQESGTQSQHSLRSSVLLFPLTRSRTQKAITLPFTNRCHSVLSLQFTKVFTQLADDSSKLPASKVEVTSPWRRSHRHYTDPEDPIGELTWAVSKNSRFQKTLAKKATLLKNTQRHRQGDGGGPGEGSSGISGQRARHGVAKRIQRSAGSESSNPASPLKGTSAFAFAGDTLHEEEESAMSEL